MSTPIRSLPGGVALSAFALFTALSIFVAPAHAQRKERQGTDAEDESCRWKRWGRRKRAADSGRRRIRARHRPAGCSTSFRKAGRNELARDGSVMGC